MMHLNDLFFTITLSTLTLCSINSAMTNHAYAGNESDAFIGKWTNYIDNETYSLNIEYNPIGSKYPYHVKFDNVYYTSYESVTCYIVAVDKMECAVDSHLPIDIKRYDNGRKVNVRAPLADWDFNYYDPDNPDPIDNDPFIKTWVSQVENTNFSLVIEHYPIWSNKYRVKYENPYAKYESDKCTLGYPDKILCGDIRDDSTPVSILHLDNAKHKITVRTLEDWKFEYYDSDYTATKEYNY